MKWEEYNEEKEDITNNDSYSLYDVISSSLCNSKGIKRLECI